MTATDVSPTAVRLFEDAAQRAGIAADRVRAFACNSANASAGDSLLSGAPAITRCKAFLKQGLRVVCGLSPTRQALMCKVEPACQHERNATPEITQGCLHAGLEGDSLLIIFTLAALAPKDQHTMLTNAYKVDDPVTCMVSSPSMPVIEKVLGIM